MKEVDQDLFVALQILKANCATNDNCCKCPMSAIYNEDGDLGCIFQLVRPYQLDLAIYDRIAAALEGEESSVYYVGIDKTASVKEYGAYRPMITRIESEEE